MRGKVIKREKGCYLRLPEEFRGMDEVEVFALRDGYYLLSAPLGGKKGGEVKDEPGVEERVIGKIESLGYRRRSPSVLKKMLSTEEWNALESLVKAGKVRYVHNKKFHEGIYLVRGRGNVRREAEPSNEVANTLFANGYIILSGSREAQELSERLSKQKGSVMGVRGFDGKYYVVTATYFLKVSEALGRIEGDTTPEEAAEKSGLSIDGCKAVLKLLAEKGDYAEKKGGIYARV